MPGLNILHNPWKFVSLSVSLLLLGMTASSSVFAQGQEITWNTFEKALHEAESNNKVMVVDVWAPWCGWCHKMKKESYPELSDELSQQFVFTRINRDDREAEYRYKGQQFTSRQLAQKLHAQTVPTVIILSSDGDYLFHVSGYLSAEKLRSLLLQTQQFTSRQ